MRRLSNAPYGFCIVSRTIPHGLIVADEIGLVGIILRECPCVV